MKPAGFFKQVFILILLFSSSLLYAQAVYNKPDLSNPASWSMVILPDPQTYVKYERNQGILELMTGWVSENIDSLNIKMVVCTGDLVEHNDWLTPDGKAANQNSVQQWTAVSGAFARLDGKVPYVAATGNHDFGEKSIEYRKTNYDQYFPVNKNLAARALLRENSINGQGYPSLSNAVYEFNTPDKKKNLLLVLEFAPRDTILRWALQTIQQPKYEKHRVILLTHSYLNADNEHIKKENYPITDGNYGAAIFEKLVRPSKNIELVISGHIGKPDDYKGHLGFRTDKNAAGKKVVQMAFNAQALGGGWMGNGGDGWLRWLEFLPNGKTVKVKTFSPFFAISPATRNLAWRTQNFDEFDFELD